MHQNNKRLNIGIIGLGYWGINYVRLFNELPETNLIAVCDSNRNILDRINRTYPHVITIDNYDQILEDKNIEAVVISTPATTHFNISKKALTFGKHILVEKPLTTSFEESMQLVDLSKKMNRLLMVGHVFEFNPAIIEIKKKLLKNELGEIYYLHFTRTGLGPIRDDVNAVWDLAPHDISILLYLFENLPISVKAYGKSFIHNKKQDVAFITLEFPNDIIANIHVSWLDPRKKREITIVGNKKMLVFDDMNPTDKIIIYDRGILKEPVDGTLGEFQLSLRIGDIHIPKIEASEPLKEQSKYFVSKVLSGEAIEKASGVVGANVVKVLETIDEKMKETDDTFCRS